MKHGSLNPKPWTLGVLITILPLVLGANPADPVLDRHGAAMVRIEVRRGSATISSGSGFITDREGSILTNAHVVEQVVASSSLSLWVQGGITPVSPWREAKIRLVNQEHDVAVLDSELRAPHPLELETQGESGLLDQIIIAGFPLGLAFKATPGVIQAIQDLPQLGEMLDLSARVDPGYSGGPVINPRGKVVGMITAMLQGANFNLALPSRRIHAVLEGLRVSTEIRTSPSEARVFVNGQFRGLSPLTLDLVPGSYLFAVEKAGHDPLEERRSLAGTTAELAFSLAPILRNTRSVRISSTPEGATVFINNAEAGTTPLDHEALVGSKLRIRVELRGYEPAHNEVVVSAEQENSVQLPMKKKGWF